MKKISFILLIYVIPLSIYSQLDGLHGDQSEIRRGLFSANNFSTTFFNEGTVGTFENNPEDVAGKWPIGSGHRYLMDGNLFIGSEVVDNEGLVQHIVSEVRGGWW